MAWQIARQCQPMDQTEPHGHVHYQTYIYCAYSFTIVLLPYLGKVLIYAHTHRSSRTQQKTQVSSPTSACLGRKAELGAKLLTSQTRYVRCNEWSHDVGLSGLAIPYNLITIEARPWAPRGSRGPERNCDRRLVPLLE